MKIKNLLILVGPPGSGKGTQGKMLAPFLNYNYVSMGSTLRAYAKSNNPDAREVKKMINSGKIIPDNMIRGIFKNTLKALPKADGVILDGFPRDIGQVSILDEAIHQHKVEKVKAIFIDVPKAEVLKRLKHRSEKEKRADDTPEVIENRFIEYDLKTHPLIEYFDRNHKLMTVHGNQSVQDVYSEILRKLSHG